MALSNYTELQASIADTLNRDDLTTVIPDFIRLAEAQLNRVVRHWRMEDRVIATVDSQYTALPNNFIEPIRMIKTSGSVEILENGGALEISKLREAANDTAGTPRIYVIVDQSFEVFPKPDSDITLELTYYEEIPDLATNSTNWLLTYFPDAYLYGSLLHSASYLQEGNRIQEWGALYQAAISAINQDGERAKMGGSGRRIKIRSYG
tara:strand:+ start:162 stop:782 length:621 start_codon:yes stop_codon:yes gene_type:complete